MNSPDTQPPQCYPPPAKRYRTRRYCVISPCRDEAPYVGITVESVLAQSERPALWIIVDDGSSDETPQLLNHYAAQHSWIRILRRPDRGKRQLGRGVMEAFYTGYATINPQDFDYLCKLDLDLQLPAVYFQRMMDRMEADPRLGCSSGKPYFLHHGRLVSEKCGDEHAVGMAKFYRIECFEEIGGFVRELMWDGIDSHRCRQLGWRAVSWDDPDIRFLHLRPMGTSDQSWWRGRVRHGVGQYYMGTHPLYMMVSGLFRMTRPPLVLGGMAMLWGYVRSALCTHVRYEDRTFRRFLRRYQIVCLLRGKRIATARLEERQQAVWLSRQQDKRPGYADRPRTDGHTTASHLTNERILVAETT